MIWRYTEDGKLTRETLDSIFRVDVVRRDNRKRMLAKNKQKRKEHLAAKRAKKH